MPDRAITRVLWNWNVKGHDLPGKLQAAAAGGFDVLTVPYAVFRPLIDGGTPAKEVLAMADANGVALDILDGMTSWGSIRYPPDNELMRSALDYSVDDALRLCDQLGLTRVVAVSGFDAYTVPAREQIVDEFGRFCERAAESGICVDLEPMAMMGLDTLEFAWDVVRKADCSNCTVAFDTWHFYRAERDYDMLRAIPRGKIRNVQIVDSGLQPIGDDIWDDVFARVLPGEGELPVVEMLRILGEFHDVTHMGPEAIQDELDRLPPDELGRRARETTDRVMQDAGYPV